MFIFSLFGRFPTASLLKNPAKSSWMSDTERFFLLKRLERSSGFYRLAAILFLSISFMIVAAFSSWIADYFHVPNAKTYIMAVFLALAMGTMMYILLYPFREKNSRSWIVTEIERLKKNPEIIQFEKMVQSREEYYAGFPEATPYTQIPSLKRLLTPQIHWCRDRRLVF